MRAPEKTYERAKRLRRDLSLPEVLLWECLRGGRLQGLRFRRQHPVGPYVLDFYHAQGKLAVEVDGRTTTCPARWNTTDAVINGSANGESE
jgi:very-short-patch-repair endonuclease